MRRSISLQWYLDGYNLVEPQPVLVSKGCSSHQEGTQGKQRLPEKFHVARAGSEPQEILLHRDIDMEAWQMQDKQQDPGAAVAQGSSLVVRMFVPLWLVYATNLPIGVVVGGHSAAAPKHGGQGGGREHAWRHADCSQEQHPQSHGDKAKPA
ncbi:TPA: hypothetical protein ACH3X2_006829 [Trebouxia sp. C0005]